MTKLTGILTSIVLGSILLTACAEATRTVATTSVPTLNSTATISTTSTANPNLPTTTLSTTAYKLMPGSFKVSVIDEISLNDTFRNKSIPLKIYYPQGDGQFPVIIFSHGGGGFTGNLLSGATVTVPGTTTPQAYEDKHPLAFLLLSPPADGTRGLTPNSWSGVTRPTMTMTGSKDDGGNGEQNPDAKLDGYNLAPAGNKYSVFIQGAYHLSFLGASIPTSPLLAQSGKPEPGEQKKIFDYIKTASLAFWDSYLKQDNGAQAYLKSSSLEQYSQNVAKITKR